MDNGGQRSGGPRVAVVAVHGIGQQQPRESVRAIAGLLLQLKYPGGAPRFAAFHETPLQVPVRPLALAPDDGKPLEQEHQFMRDQLAQYQPASGPYDTSRMEGVGLTPDGRASERIHLYELYWEDLSRLGSGALRIVGSLYQLLFDIANLGKVAAELTPSSEHEWPAYQRLHAATVWIFTRLVPLTWLLMLGTSLTLLLLQVPAGAVRLALSVMAGGLVFVLAWIAHYRTRREGGGASMRWAIAVSIVGIAAAFTTGTLLEAVNALTMARLVTLAWTLVMCGLIVWIFRAYARLMDAPAGAARTNGVAHVSWFGAALVLAFTLGMALPAPSIDHLVARIIELFVAETAVTVAIWYLMYLMGSIAALIGASMRIRMRRRSRRGPDSRLDHQRRALRRTHWTAAASLALATSATLIITFVLWSAILRTSRGLLQPLPAELLTKRFVCAPFAVAPGDPETIFAFLTYLLEASAGAGYIVLLVGTLVMVLTAIVVLVPAIRAEQRGTAAMTPDASRRLGRDLSDGLATLGVATLVLFVATYALHPLTSLLHWYQDCYAPAGPLWAILEDFEHSGSGWIAWSGGLLGASGVGFFLLRERLGPVIDTALDVDNYMRRAPVEATTRARIAERYASLLRYLNSWCDAEGQSYDRVIIVAHSQGTAITADLLGFARREEAANGDLFPLLHGPDRPSPQRRLSLFTMGSPLRQVYARTFPVLFEWMNVPGRRWGRPVKSDEIPAPATPGQLPDDIAPDPAGLGLWRWVNAYASGDYVGRSIWRRGGGSDETLYAPDHAVSDAIGRRRELCIGGGAHTGYWKPEATPIARELDALIRGDLAP